MLCDKYYSRPKYNILWNMKIHKKLPNLDEENMVRLLIQSLIYFYTLLRNID